MSDPGVRRHLRQLFPDPITGKKEWGLVPAPGGGIMAVHSLSEAKPIKIAGFEAENQLFEGKLRYSEWVFGALAMPAAAGKAPGTGGGAPGPNAAGIPPQVPGSLPPQTPALFPGQVPAQVPGSLPPQTPSSFPGQGRAPTASPTAPMR